MFTAIAIIALWAITPTLIFAALRFDAEANEALSGLAVIPWTLFGLYLIT